MRFVWILVSLSYFQCFFVTVLTLINEVGFGVVKEKHIYIKPALGGVPNVFLKFG